VLDVDLSLAMFTLLQIRQDGLSGGLLLFSDALGLRPFGVGAYR